MKNICNLCFPRMLIEQSRSKNLFTSASCSDGNFQFALCECDGWEPEFMVSRCTRHRQWPVLVALWLQQLCISFAVFFWTGNWVASLAPEKKKKKCKTIFNPRKNYNIRDLLCICVIRDKCCYIFILLVKIKVEIGQQEERPWTVERPISSELRVQKQQKLRSKAEEWILHCAIFLD